ncbi:MAG: protein TolR [Deltaproteobacteria bacterium]
MAFSMNGRNRSAMSEINVTPLVDVMLVLLIIFMVTAPMMQEGIAVDLPQAKGSELTKKQEVDEIIISVSGQGKIYVNENPVAEDALPQTILDMTKKGGSPEVYLRADKEVPYGIVVRIMAALKAAGIANLGMITVSPESRPEG